VVDLQTFDGTLDEDLVRRASLRRIGLDLTHHPGGFVTKGSATGGQQPIYVAKAEFFKVLGHPARVRILELLRDGERSVSELQAELKLDSSGTSQHLGVLRRQGVLESRREGTSVYYRVRDPRTFQLLESARQILTSSLEATQALLAEMVTDPPPGARRRRVLERGE
jgi:DNA-binding transcriptional ArsR family regulator